MANEEHLALLKQGIPLWNRWRQLHRKIQPDLYSAYLHSADLHSADLHNVNLSQANLRRASLYGANLRGANLNRADLHRANLSQADLSEADLRKADLNEADLSEADLRSANLSNAFLSGANLSSAFLSQADLSDALVSSTNLSGAYLNGTFLKRAITSATIFSTLDLRTARGLAEIIHQGPSHIELYSVQLPQDGSALHFLRGVGVPDEWIDFYRAMMQHPIQYHSVFISYSSKDDTLARRLHADLQDQGVRCWFAPKDMKIGDKIRARIDEAIQLQDKLLLLLSEQALDSTWVEDEVEAALEKERRQQREVLFPVRLDESMMVTQQPWATKLRRQRHIGDFTGWKDPDDYQRAFTRLLRDLKAGSSLVQGTPGA